MHHYMELGGRVRGRAHVLGKVGAGIADPTSPVGFRRIGLFRVGSGTLDYWEGEPEAGSG
jgi:hypothetical protein